MHRIQHRSGYCLALFLLVVQLMTFALQGSVQAASSATDLEQLRYEVGLKAYAYAYPLVLMEVTRRQMTNAEDKTVIGHGPMNRWFHAERFPDASFKGVVRANVDTLYSILWGDVSREPLLISVPDSQGRYYMLPLLDMWTDVFAVPGTRTTGNQAQIFAVAGPDWQGEVPAGVRLIRSPTPCFWLIGRIQTNGTGDYKAVHRFQAGLQAVPLSAYGKSYTPSRGTVDPAIDMKTPPVRQMAAMDAGEFFGRFAELLKRVPPHYSDYPLLSIMERRLGFKVGESFDVANLDPALQKGLARAVQDGPRLLHKVIKAVPTDPSGWKYYLKGGNYGINYGVRAAIALIGLGMNLPEDAVYPIAYIDGKGRELNGAQRYRLHFSKEQLPPADAFWSVMIYDKEGFFIDNPLNRYALGDRDPLQYNADGSLDLYIQSSSPGKEQESNWLPAPVDGVFSLVTRIYAPRASVLNGSWKMPPIQRVD